MREFFNSVSKFFKRDPNKGQEQIHTQLQSAILENDLDKVLILIKKGANLNSSGKGLYPPPLHLAMKENRFLIVSELLRAGADVNLADGLGQTPLHQAVRYNQEIFILALLKMKADPNIKDAAGKTPLHLIPQANPRVADILVKYGAHINERDHNGDTPLHHCVDYPAAAERLLALGADFNVRNTSAASPYMLLLDETRLRLNPDMLQKMFALKADPNAMNVAGSTALHVVAKLELEDLLLHVLQNGAALSAQDRSGNNVLHILARTQNTPMMMRVLELVDEQTPGIIENTNKNGLTPLGELLCSAYRAGGDFSNRYVAAARLLLDHKASPDSVDDRGRGLLHAAVMSNKTSFLEEALIRGANPDLADKEGKTALHYAIQQKSLRAMDILLDRNANPDMTDAQGWTMLDRLAEKGDRESPIVQLLIVAGGSYHKQLPLHPEAMRRPKLIDKPRKDAGPGFKL